MTAAAEIGFSWDTVPKFLYLSGRDQFTAEELRYIADIWQIPRQEQLADSRR